MVKTTIFTPRLLEVIGRISMLMLSCFSVATLVPENTFSLRVIILSIFFCFGGLWSVIPLLAK